jgi:hypothetical protein
MDGWTEVLITTDQVRAKRAENPNWIPEVHAWLTGTVGDQAVFSTRFGIRGDWTSGVKDSQTNFYRFQDPNMAMLFKLMWA